MDLSNSYTILPIPAAGCILTGLPESNCGTLITSQPDNLRNFANLGISLLDRTPVNKLLTDIYINDVKDRNDNQLSLNLF